MIHSAFNERINMLSTYLCSLCWVEFSDVFEVCVDIADAAAGVAVRQLVVAHKVDLKTIAAKYKHNKGMKIKMRW